MIWSLIQSIASPILSIVDKAVTDKDLALKLKAQIQTTLENNAHIIKQRAADLVLAEVKGESWMQRNWRPCFMFLLMGLLLYALVIMPILSIVVIGHAMTLTDAWSSVPDGLWNIILVGMGGYIAGRSVEKTAGNIAVSKKDNNIVWDENGRGRIN